MVRIILVEFLHALPMLLARFPELIFLFLLRHHHLIRVERLSLFLHVLDLELALLLFGDHFFVLVDEVLHAHVLAFVLETGGFVDLLLDLALVLLAGFLLLLQ